MNKKAFYIETMGCQMNEYDSDYLARSLINCGFVPVDCPDDADLILINTCTVRAKAEQKAYSAIGRMSAQKTRRSGLILGVVGCMAQQKGADLIQRFPMLDLVIGPREISTIPEILSEMSECRKKVIKTNLKPDPPPPVFCQRYFEKRVSGYISIMQGCNNFCSYCIVPFVRGREVSRSPEEIFDESNGLISQGIKEISLLGQNVNSYVWEKGDKWDFSSLLRRINGIEGLLRLRFTTSHPKDLSDKLIQCFNELDKLCSHIHLPFQAGSNTVLKSMKRGYTREHYMELIGKLRAASPDIAVTSDVMVGFPGESEKDFLSTLDLIEKIEFDSLFSFKYSDRKGTFAEKMKDKIEESEKSSRLRDLQELQKEISLRKNMSLEGKTVEVLVEGESKKGGQLTGRTASNKVVNFKCDNKVIGRLINVKIKHGFLNSLEGEIPGRA